MLRVVFHCTGRSASFLSFPVRLINLRDVINILPCFPFGLDFFQTLEKLLIFQKRQKPGLCIMSEIGDESETSLPQFPRQTPPQ